MNIATQTAYLRKQRQWTLGDLAERTGLSLSYLSDIERGRTTPSVESIERLVTAFDTTIPLFMGGASFELTTDEREMLDAYRTGNLEQMMRLALNRLAEVNR